MHLASTQTCHARIVLFVKENALVHACAPLLASASSWDLHVCSLVTRALACACELLGTWPRHLTRNDDTEREVLGAPHAFDALVENPTVVQQDAT